MYRFIKKTKALGISKTQYSWQRPHKHLTIKDLTNKMSFKKE